MLLPKKDATLPQDPLFSKLLKLATQRGDQIIVDDCSRGVRFGYRHILHGTVTLQQQLQCLLDSSILENRGGFFVALLAPNGYEFIVGTLAVLALGGVVVPMPTGALPAELSHMLQQCRACYLLYGPEQIELAAQIRNETQIPSLAIESHVDDAADSNLLPLTSYTLDPSLTVSEECPSIVFFTSGTTGPPKGVLHPRRTITKYALTSETEPPAEDEICLIPRGAFWSLYFTKLFQMLLLGVRVEIQNFGRNYDLIWEKFRERTGTKIVLSPTFWYGLMRYFEDHISKLPEAVMREYVEGFRYLRDVGMTGAMPSNRLREFWLELGGGRPLKVQYGITETQEISVWEEGSGTSEADLGTPFPNVILKLSEGDEGEVLVKTPSLFLGYLNSPQSTAQRFTPDGFFKTGDLATRHNGRYIFQGRENMDMFKFYTYKVPRLHVEHHLLALPYIAEGYILPVADPACDTRVAALVRFRSPGPPAARPPATATATATAPCLRVLREDLKGKMPAYQLPTVLRVLGEGEVVPRTWSDKVALGEVVGRFFGGDGMGDGIRDGEVEVWDVGGFMRGETERMWDLAGMR